MGRGFPARGSSGNAVEYSMEDQAEIDSRLTKEHKKKIAKLEDVNMPMLAELQYLEKHWTKKGIGYLTEPQEEELPVAKVNWYEKFALCVTQIYDNTNQYITKTALQVNSPALKTILKNVIGEYPGLSFYTSDISIAFPPRCLYHYRPELQNELAKQISGSEERLHLPVLLRFIDQHFEDAIKDGDNLREQGLISYELLWTIFKPGSIIFAPSNGKPRAYRLESYGYVCGEEPGLQLSVKFFDFDGDQFTDRAACLRIPAFMGTKPITELSAFALHFHPQRDLVERALITRGRKWEAHAGQNLRYYSGIALDLAAHLRYNINGRIMIDAKTFHRINPNAAFAGTHQGPVRTRNRKRGADELDFETVNELPTLSDEQCLLASNLVRGFAFTEKKFLDFYIDQISEIEWNTKCFTQLVLPDSQKELVQALVSEHTARATDPSAGFDDIVQGKGKGLILVLHGPPGVGKTLTAECVAESAQRPLYVVSSGELGTNSSDLDAQLSQIMDLASTWKAVLLIDEADVFLESRSLHDMERNSMVSIFLRTLEYYSGILFMTTNRVRTFDDAFKSRIHVPLKYEELPQSSRMLVWKNFLGKADLDVDIDEEGYQNLSYGHLNGRQIKNVVRTAKSLARYKKRKLNYEQLDQVMKIQMAFEKELASPNEEVVLVNNRE